VALRDNPFGELKVPLALTAAVALLVAVVVAIAILLSDRRETLKEEAYGVTRQVGDAVAAPVSGVVAAPGRWGGQGLDALRGYFFAVSENRRLKAELKEARQWRDVALALRDTNDRYHALLGLKTEPPIPMVAARTVSDSRGPFANSRLANAGKEKNVEPGNPVMSENGLVGRIIGVTKGASRILLLTDVASRTPVMIDRTNARAILTGDGGPNPRLEYLRGKEPVRQGDRVLTSGDGGVLPRGLPVGVAVKGLDGRWRVVLASDTAPIDFVQILLFKDFTQLSASAKAELDRMDPLPPSEGAATITAQTPPPAPAPAPPLPKPAAATPLGAQARPPAAGRPAGQTAAKPAASKPAQRKPAPSTPAAAPAAAPAPAPAEAEIPH
jgi:rod shape-determining protein MreC